MSPLPNPNGKHTISSKNELKSTKLTITNSPLEAITNKMKVLIYKNTLNHFLRHKNKNYSWICQKKWRARSATKQLKYRRKMTNYSGWIVNWKVLDCSWWHVGRNKSIKSITFSRTNKSVYKIKMRK